MGTIPLAHPPSQIMRLHPGTIFATALLMVVATTLHAQAPSATPASEKQAIIRRILEVTKAADNMLATMEAALPTQRASNPAIPSVFWERFMARASQQRYAFVDSLIPIYEKHFSTADLKEMLRFYETPVGKRMVAALPEVMNESLVAWQRWGFVIGKEIGEELQREAMTTKSPEMKH
jgi:uncharacterized protein